MQADINTAIDREIEFAKARWGETRELICLQGSRNRILDDKELLRMLRYFWLHGTVYAYVLARTRPALRTPHRFQESDQVHRRSGLRIGGGEQSSRL
jgi:hypothetical protein